MAPTQDADTDPTAPLALRAHIDLTPHVEGIVIHDLAPTFGMGAGGLKGLLRFPSPARWDETQMAAVEAAVRTQAERDGLTPEAFLTRVYAEEEF